MHIIKRQMGKSYQLLILMTVLPFASMYLLMYDGRQAGKCFASFNEL